MHKSILSSFFMVGLILCYPLLAVSNTIMILPVTDKGASDTDNDGIYETIEPEWLEGSRVSDRGYSPYPSRVAMEFDLSSLQNNNIIIDSAYLSFYPKSWSDTDGGLEVHGYYGDGVITESDMLETNFLGGPFRPRDINQTTPVFIQDVTSLVSGMGNNNYVGFRFGLYPDQDNFFITLATKEFTINESLRPTLNVDYSIVPIPGAISLFISGLIGFVSMARRRET